MLLLRSPPANGFVRNIDVTFAGVVYLETAHVRRGLAVSLGTADDVDVVLPDLEQSIL